jgi:hypothetical protein
MRALAILALGVLASSAQGVELFRRGDFAVDLSGSVRAIGVATRGTSLEDFEQAAFESFPGGISIPNPVCFQAARFEECPAFHEVGRTRVWQSLARIRARVDLQFLPSLSARIEYDNELVMVYRGWLNWETEHFQVLLGRQRIPWGVGRLWNPIDRFNPIPPLAIEQDESPGIDSVVATWFAADAVALDAVYAPGDDGDDPSYALRLHGLVADTDYSLMAGVFDDANTVGATLERNLGDMAVHLEAVYADPDARYWPVGRPRPRSLPPFWQVVVSLDTNIDVGKGIYALIEHLYNGNALGRGRGRAGSLLPLFESTATPPAELSPALQMLFPGPYVQTIGSERFGGSRVVTLALHQTGAMLGYDVTEALRGDLLVLYDWNGHSAAIAPQLRYTPRGDLEVTLGLQVFTGPRASQYGQAEHLAFLIVEYFF